MKYMYCEKKLTIKEILENKDICNDCLSDEITLDNQERQSINFFYLWNWIFRPQ